MGFPKPLLPFGKSTFLRHIIDLHHALGLQVQVVLGEHRERIQTVIDLSDVETLVNPAPERGQLSSLQLAIGRLSGPQGALVHPVDHPAVQLDTLRRLVEAAQELPGRLVFPKYAGSNGHPVVFPHELFPEILAAPLEEGARFVVRRYPELVVAVEVEDPGVAINVDTPEEYDRLRSS
jgi:molybdenum cofactor cytidylyltransferase